MPMPVNNKKWMLRALSLARRGAGFTSPNPMVGAVIVRGGRLVGEGWHRRRGAPHAEINAIKDAGGKVRGATLYVTLEPCCTHGLTPPCTDAIISSGIRKVVVGCLDQNPKHKGRGIEILRKAGIDVEYPVEEDKCRELNEAFFHWIETKLPFVLLKLAMTLDGKIATAGGSSKWITGPEARRRVQKLRQWADAILVGAETVRADHPQLTVRDFKKLKQPRRLVASTKMTEAELLRLMPEGLKPEIVKAKGREGWINILTKLGKEEVTSLLVEGGGELASSLLNAGVVDKIEFHVAPKILGGRNSCPAVGGTDPASLEKALKIEDIQVRRIGGDLCITGRPAKAGKS